MPTNDKYVQCEDVSVPERTLLLVELLMKKVEQLEEKINNYSCLCQCVRLPPLPPAAPQLKPKPLIAPTLIGVIDVNAAVNEPKPLTAQKHSKTRATSIITRSQKIAGDLKDTTRAKETSAGKRDVTPKASTSQKSDGTPVSANDVSLGNSTTGEEWSTVVKRKRAAIAIRGSFGGAVRGAEVVKNYHFYPFHRDTTVADMNDYIKKITNCTADFTVVKLKSKGDYASFKVGIPTKLSTLVLKAENWPRHSFIKEWVARMETPRLPSS